MPENNVEHRLDAEGADQQVLAGINDANLQELAKSSGCRVILRGDHLILSGEVNDVEKAVPVAQRLIDLAKTGQDFDADDVRREYAMLSQRGPRRRDNGDAGSATGSGSGSGSGESEQVVLAGLRKLIGSRSEGQAHYLESIKNNDVVIAIGPAGTGKTYLAVAAAIDAHRKNRVKRIVLARPAVEAGENLGFLPGDLQEKVDPYLRPLYDALEDIMPPDWVRRALEARTIEIAPLAYMRGRTLADAFVILDEAQNATTAQMKMFLTRLGLNSKVVITGDKTQIDLPRKDDSGLLEIERILTGIDGIDIVYLDSKDVVRHRLVKEIIHAYTKSDEERGEPVSVAVEISQIDTEAPRSILAQVRKAVEAALKHESVEEASISVTLLNDARIRAMNRKYLEHDEVTDVISFPLYERGEKPVGDVYIGYEQAERQASDADVDIPEEVARLAIHGTLHVLGYDHPEDESRMRSEMWQLQEAILKTLS